LRKLCVLDVCAQAHARMRAYVSTRVSVHVASRHLQKFTNVLLQTHLQVLVGVPVAVVDDDRVGCLKVDAEAACSCAVCVYMCCVCCVCICWEDKGEECGSNKLTNANTDTQTQAQTRTNNKQTKKKRNRCDFLTSLCCKISYSKKQTAKTNKTLRTRAQHSNKQTSTASSHKQT